VYNRAISVGPDGYLKLRTGSEPTAVRFVNRLDENTVTVTLTWNDYRDTEDAGTDKDLDLIVEDGRGRVVGESKLKQIPAGRDAQEGETKNPRERLVLTDLPANPKGEEYRIRVKANSANFRLQDRVRVLVSAARSTPLTDPESGKTIRPIEFLDATSGREIYPPADHAGVLTVGDVSPGSAVGPTADGRVKPDVILAESVARFSNGEESVGSSNAAAFFAGSVLVMKATVPGLTTAHVREWVRKLDSRKPAADTTAKSSPAPATTVIEPLTPNQQRAMRYATAAVDEQKRRGETDPKVYVSGSNGSFVVRPNSTPASSTTVRAAPPDAPKSALYTHSPWQTPSPSTLADLVRPPK
jgi:hypothetical protein